MNILLTNDDGYTAEGINVLYEQIKDKHNVKMCAPLKQMSASGHAITLFKPMEFLRVSDSICAVDGTPADCVKCAIFGIYKDIKFDLVLSGINNGPNMCEDVFPSGTVAGAREGLINNLFSIACSVDGWNGDKHFEFPAKFIAELLDKLDEEILSLKLILNINFPNTNNAKGIRFTHIGSRVYNNFILFEKKDGKEYVTITGEDQTFNKYDGSDLEAVDKGFISITPMTNEFLHKPYIDKLSKIKDIKTD